MMHEQSQDPSGPTGPDVQAFEESWSEGAPFGALPPVPDSGYSPDAVPLPSAVAPPAEIASRLAAHAIRLQAMWADPEVKALLSDLAETIAARPTTHVIEFAEHGWVLQHPLIGCGLDLFTCRHNEQAERQFAHPPTALGRYPVEFDPAGTGRLHVLWDEPVPVAVATDA